MYDALQPALTSASSSAQQTVNQIALVTTVVVSLGGKLQSAATLLTAAHTAIGVNAPDGSMSALDTDIVAAATAATAASNALAAAATNVGNLSTLLGTAANTLAVVHADLENTEMDLLFKLS